MRRRGAGNSERRTVSWDRLLRCLIPSSCFLIPVMAAAVLAAQAPASAPDGSAIFQKNCASCHDGAAGSRAPSPDVLKQRSPESILSALTAGGMRPQGGRLSGVER